MGSGKVKSVDYPTVDDRLAINLKNSGRLKQKKLVAKGCHATEKVIFLMEIQLNSHDVDEIEEKYGVGGYSSEMWTL